MATFTGPSTESTQPQAVVDASFVPRGSVEASLQFYDALADGGKPFNYPLGTEPPDGQPRRNFGDVEIPVVIEDIRGREALYNLDDNAFTTLKAGLSRGVDFTSDESIKREYYPEVEATLLKHLPEAKRIFLFDHTVRPSGGSRPPVLRAHIDQSKTAAEGRVRHFFPRESDDLLEGRVRIINVWRPLNGPVQSFPLAFADSKTVADETLHVVEHRYADRTGEALSLEHGEERWYYWSGVENDERLLLECYDSEKGGRLPHTAFKDPRTPHGAPPRHSIEVRALVFG